MRSNSRLLGLRAPAFLSGKDIEPICPCPPPGQDATVYLGCVLISSSPTWDHEAFVVGGK